MRNDLIEGNGRGTYVALDTSDDKGIWDHPTRREAQGDGAAIVLRERDVAPIARRPVDARGPAHRQERLDVGNDFLLQQLLASSGDKKVG